MSKDVYSAPFHEELDATVVISPRDKSRDVLKPEEVAEAALYGEHTSLDGSGDELLDEDDLDLSLMETQDVSSWLDENLFAPKKDEQVEDKQATAEPVATESRVEPVALSKPELKLESKLEPKAAPMPKSASKSASKSGPELQSGRQSEPKPLPDLKPALKPVAANNDGVGNCLDNAGLSDFFSGFENDAPEPPPSSTASEVRKAQTVARGYERRDMAPNGAVQNFLEQLKAKNKLPLASTSLLVLLSTCGAVAYSMMQQESVAITEDAPQTLSLMRTTDELAEPQLQVAASQESPVPAAAQLPAELPVVAADPSQERFCLTQGIRLGAAIERSAALNGAGSAALQSMFAEFAQSCKNYQFVPEVYLANKLTIDSEQAAVPSQMTTEPQSDALVSEPAIAAVEPQAELVDEMLTAPAQPVAARPSAPSPDKVLSTSELIKNVQWRLVKLGFYKPRADGKGRIDGVYNAGTQAAVNAFFAQHSDLRSAQTEAEIFRAIDSVYAKN